MYITKYGHFGWRRENFEIQVKAKQTWIKSNRSENVDLRGKKKKRRHGVHIYTNLFSVIPFISFNIQNIHLFKFCSSSATTLDVFFHWLLSSFIITRPVHSLSRQIPLSRVLVASFVLQRIQNLILHRQNLNRHLCSHHHHHHLLLLLRLLLRKIRSILSNRRFPIFVRFRVEDSP